MVGSKPTNSDLIEKLAAIEQAHSRLLHLLSTSPLIIYSSQPYPPYRITFISENVQSQLGYMPQDFFNDPNLWFDCLHPKDRGQRSARLEALFQNDSLCYEYRFRRRDGDYRWILDEQRLARDAAGQPVEIVGYWVDISERKQAEQTQRRLSAILESSTDFIGWSDPGGISHYVNRAGCEMVGMAPQEAVGLPITAFSPDWAQAIILNEGLPQARQRGWWRGETALCDRAGREIPVSQLILAHRDAAGEVEFFSTIARDIRDRRAYEAQLERLTYYDGLTGLPNRNLLQLRLRDTLTRARRRQRQVAVLFLDLDRFRRINDSLGHEAGDSLLQAVAGRLSAGLREGDTVARLGSDEFVLVLGDLPPGSLRPLLTRKVRALFESPFEVASHKVVITASVGVCMFPEDSQTPKRLLLYAYIALHHARAQGWNRLQFYTAEKGNHPMGHFLTLENSLRSALQGGALDLYYQPQVDGSMGRVVGVEALLRWRHPQRGIIAPAEFMFVAEESGLIISLGRWVLQHQAWREAGLLPVSVSVNLSARQFLQADLIDQVAEALQRSGLAAEALELEITESMIMQNITRAQAHLFTLKDLGVSVAIDDFGTGYSSLSYLKRFPVDALKIDRAFVRDLATSPADAAIVQAIINLGHSLKLKVVAEGVETKAQWAFLQKHGCDIVQGYYFSPPRPAQELTTQLREKGLKGWEGSYDFKERKVH